MTPTNAPAISPILWRVSIHFTVLSIIAAMLTGMGMRSSSLPALVISVSVLALVVSDHFGWIEISRTWSYVAMLCGAAIALYGYWFDRQSNVYYGISNLHAVARMLVYIQLPLMFQKKDPRLFEHWGVFILLEFIVAALLNDNVLFGIALIPSLVVGCATLMVLTYYLSDVQADVAGAERLSFFASFWKSIQSKSAEPTHTSPIQMSSETRLDGQASRKYVFGSWVGLLLGNGVLLFAVVYFFGLPRLHTGAYEGLGYNKPMVGFSGTVSLDDVGELMLSDDLAFRMSIQESRSKLPFAPTAPPYIRGSVVEIYDGLGNWRTSLESTKVSELPLLNQLRDEFGSGSNTHIVTIQEQARLGAAQFSVPPFFRGTNSSRLMLNPATWCLRDTSFEEKQFQSKKRYRYETSAFQLARQSPYLLDFYDCLQDSASNRQRTSKRAMRNQQVDMRRFAGLTALRDEILSANPAANAFEKAIALEDYLATSKIFTYSLLPKVNRENGIDPIEDFATNHRTGHCQYFASTLAIMLRSLGLPTRIVVGFRPGEYNEIGNYFVVRQRHAHSWVEVHLDRDQIQENTLGIPEWSTGGIWLRLDPTPQGEGSNAGGSLRNASQSGQSLEAFEQLWKDGFMDFDASSQPEAIGAFGASGDGLVAMLLRSIERVTLQLQSRSLGGGGISTENWFSWRGGVFASGLAIAGLITFRILSRFRWRNIRFQRRDELLDSKRYHRTSWLLFRRMLKALSRVGLHRKPYQTPLEFVEASQIWLDRNGFLWPSGKGGLRSFIEAIYSTRYGSADELSPEICQSFDATIRALEDFSKHKPILP